MASFHREILINDIRTCIINTVGPIGLELDNLDDLRSATFWEDLEPEFEGLLFKKFGKIMDIFSIVPLTMNNIADLLEAETGDQGEDEYPIYTWSLNLEMV